MKTFVFALVALVGLALNCDAQTIRSIQPYSDQNMSNGIKVQVDLGKGVGYSAAFSNNINGVSKYDPHKYRANTRPIPQAKPGQRYQSYPRANPYSK